VIFGIIGIGRISEIPIISLIPKIRVRTICSGIKNAGRLPVLFSGRKEEPAYKIERVFPELGNCGGGGDSGMNFYI